MHEQNLRGCGSTCAGHRICLKSRMKVADLSSKEEIAIFEKAKNQVEETGIQLRNSS